MREIPSKSSVKIKNKKHFLSHHEIFSDEYKIVGISEHERNSIKIFCKNSKLRCLSVIMRSSVMRINHNSKLSL